MVLATDYVDVRRLTGDRLEGDALGVSQVHAVCSDRRDDSQESHGKTRFTTEGKNESVRNAAYGVQRTGSGLQEELS